MTKVKKSDINILIMLVGVLLAVISYFVVYQNFTEKTDALSAENATLQTEVDELQKLADNKTFYLEETARMDDEIKAIIAGFPSEVRAEDVVMYTDNLEKINAIWVTELKREDTQLVQVATDAQAAPATDAVVENADGTGTDAAQQDAVTATGGLKDVVFLYSSPFSISYKTTYRSIKDIIASIVDSDDRMNITAISLTYDSETGCLSGSLDATMYTMSGTGNTYEELDIPGVRLGTADIFKSGAVLTREGAANVNGSDTQSEGEEGETEETEETEEEENSDDEASSNN